MITFFLAPILALALGPLARRVSKEQAVPYGPFLALGAVIVMFSWRWIWMLEFNFGTSDPSHVDDWSTSFAVRRLFGAWVLLSGLAVVAIGGTAGLMGLMRIFWTLPVEREPEKLEADRSGKLDG